MFKKIIFALLILEILIFWPLSLIKEPVNISFKTIFFPVTEQEKIVFNKKLDLDTSMLKRFYYNRTSIVKDRYLKNFSVLIDSNNYFFLMHPREDVSGVDYRFKYPFWAIIFFISAIGVTIKNKKYFKIWLIILLEVITLSFFQKIDGLDLILFLPISYLLYLGAKEFDKYKYNWILNLGLLFLIEIEIGRIFL